MTAVIRNGGPDDTAIIFGVALANGRKYLVDEMTLQVTGGGRVEEYRYRPMHYPGVIAGRIDDWIVPLPVGTSYTLTFQPVDFVSTSVRLNDLPKDARLSLRLRTRGATTSPQPDVMGLRGFHVWTGSNLLTSNELPVCP